MGLWILLALLTAVPLVLRAVFAAHVELSPDEAYYASWAARLDASYFDHPPLVAWLIWRSMRGEPTWLTVFLAAALADLIAYVVTSTQLVLA